MPIFRGREFVSALSDWKDSVRAASSVNINLASTSVTSIDGVALNHADRVLLAKQTNASQNGIYFWNSLTQQFVRSKDADSSIEVSPGMKVYVEEGNTNAQSTFLLSNIGTITIGVTNLVFTKNSSLVQLELDGTFGGANAIPSITVNKTGQVTSITQNPVFIGNTNLEFNSISINGAEIPLGAEAIFNSDDFAEGSTNLYYTDEKVNSAIDTRITKSFIEALNIDAGTLNGQQGSYYLNWNNLTNKPSIPSTLTDLGITDGTQGQVLTTNGSGEFTFTTVSGGDITLESLNNVTITTPTSGQVLKYNGNSWVNDVDSGGISLTDLSIGTDADASGSGSISYDNSTGVFTYTPPDMTGKLDLSGGTMTGALILSGAPTSDLEAATKQYVDLATASVNINSIGDISDVTLTLPEEGQILKYNGLEWVNEAFTPGDALPSQDGNAGKLLTTDGTNASWVAPALVAGVASFTKEVFTATANQTIFVANYTVGYIDVYLNGIKLIDTEDYMATTGTAIEFQLGAEENDIIEIVKWENTPNAAYTRYSYNATAAQTSFAAEYFVGTVDVYVNGIKLSATLDYTATNGTSIELASAADLDDIVEIVAWQNITATSGVNLLPSQTGSNGYILSTNGTTASWIPAPTGFSGDYNDLANTPDLSVYQLSATAFSGDYTDLTNKPTLFSGNYGDLTGTPDLSVYQLSATAFSGDYTDLTSKPDLSVYQLSATAFSGDYTDLTNKPTLFSGSYTDLTDKPTIPSLTGYATETYVNTAVSNLVDTAPDLLNTLNELAAALGDDPDFATTITGQIALKANSADLATVATSGSYADLTNKPTLFSGDYNDLTNAPTIPDITGKLDLSGGTMTGSLILSGAPIADLEAATKQYVDLATASVNINSIGDISDVTLTLPEEGQILKYNGLEWVNEAFTPGDALPDQTGNAGKLLTTDGTTASWVAPALVAGVASYTKEVFTAAASQTVYAVTYTVGYIDVYRNGVRLIDTEDYTATDGVNVTLSSAPDQGDIIEIVAWENTPNAAYTRYSYTATAAQTSFAAEYFIGTVDVYLNGIKLSDTTDYTAINGTSIEFLFGADENDIVEIIAWQNITTTSGVNLLPSQTGNNGYILATDGTTASWVPAPTGFSGDYNDLTNNPDLSVYQLSASAFSGSYIDLTDKPTLFSGDYNDLINTPTIPSLTGYATETYVNTAVSNLVDTAPDLLNTLNELAAALGDDPNFATTITGQIALKANSADLATVATSGSYADLTNKPDLSVYQLSANAFSGSYNDLTNKPTLFSGSYTDLTNKPDLSVYQLSASAFSGDYNDLTNTPAIPDITGKLDLSGGTMTGSLILSGDPTVALEAATKQYVDAATASVNINSIGDISDVTLTSLESGQILKYNGLEWVNEAFTPGDALPSQTDNAGKLLTTDGTNASWITPALVAGVASYTKEVFTATTDQTVFNTTYTVGYIDVYFNGVKLLDSDDYTATTGNSIVLSVAAIQNDVVEVVKWENIPNAAYTRYSYNATAAQTSFTADYFVGTVDVYVNGIRLADTTDYTATNGTSIELVSAAELDDIVEIIAWQNITATSGVNLLPSQTGNNGYILATDGTTASWIPAPTGFSGDYNDLTNTPTLFSGSYADLTNTPDLSVYQLSANAFSGDYTDLTNKPTLFSGSYTDLTNKPTTLTLSSLTVEALTFSGTGAVVISSGNDLEFTAAGNITFNGQELSTVATSGDYNDLTNKPTIPSLTGYATEAYVNTAVANLVDTAPTTLDTLNELAAALGDDPNFATTVSNQIGLKANSADLATVAISGSYNDLIDTPTIPDITGKLDLSGGTMTGSLILSGAPTTDLEAATKQYVDLATASVNINSIGDISDVTLTSLESGQILKYNGLEWVNEAFTAGDALPDQTNNAGKLLSTDGTTASWVAPALIAGVASYTRELFTATADQTTFAVTYTVGYIDVYLNGFKLIDTADYTATNGTSIELTLAALQDDVLEVVVWENVPNAAYTRYSYSVSSDQTIFNADYYIGTVDVYLNGIRLTDSTDYTATTGVNIVLTSPAIQGDLVEIIAWQNITATSGVNLLPSQTGSNGYVLSTDGTTASWIPAPTGFSGDYNDLTNKPDLSVYQLSANAFSGSYADLTNKPTLFSGDYNDLTNTPDLSVYQLSANAFSGSYADLTNKPTLFSGDYNDLINTPTIPSLTGYATETYVNTAVSNLVDTAPDLLNTLNELAAALGDDPNFATTITGQIALKANSADLATVATTGSYADLTNKPTIPSDVNQLTDTNSLLSGTAVTVSETAPLDPSEGDLWFDPGYLETFIYYQDGNNNFSWVPINPTGDTLPSQTGNNGYILATDGTTASWIPAPTGFSGDYNDLTNKPDLSVYQLSANAFSGDYTDLTNKPTLLTQTDIDNSIAALVDAAPETLNTLNELAAALGDDPNFATTITTQIGLKANAADLASVATSGDYNDLINTPVTDITGKLDISGGTMTGSLILSGDPTVALEAATKQYVDAATASANINSIGDISDVTLTSLESGQILKYNGLEWVNEAFTPSVDGVASYTKEVFTATADQTTFAVNYTVGYIDVYLNGFRLIDSDYVATNGTSIVLNIGASENDIIEVVVWANSEPIIVAGVASYTKEVFTATADQTTFAVNYTVGYIDVYLNGIRLIDTDDYTATDGTSIVLLLGAEANDIVEVVIWDNTPSWKEKTTNYTAVAGDRLFVDCSGGAVTVTLPSTPIMGDEIRIIDATGSAATNNITISRNGNNILGVAEDLVIQTNRAAFGLVFYNSTQGWVLMEK